MQRLEAIKLLVFLPGGGPSSIMFAREFQLQGLIFKLQLLYLLLQFVCFLNLAFTHIVDLLLVSRHVLVNYFLDFGVLSRD